MEDKMQNHQKINCEVSSCMYNEKDNNSCLLKDIIVRNCRDCNASCPEDSMCASYKCR